VGIPSVLQAKILHSLGIFRRQNLVQFGLERLRLFLDKREPIVTYSSRRVFSNYLGTPTHAEHADKRTAATATQVFQPPF